MTYYQQQLLRIRREHFHPEYLYKQVAQAKYYMDQHFAEDIGIDRLAATACFSKFHFIRMFRAAYGITPNQYLISVRIAQAKQLLKSNKTIVEVCHAVGFTSLSSFSGLFRKITGTTPAAYRCRCTSV
ncbi:MAG TPA: AraC family transcriptional regulator [Ohtaekwangia sp.]|uniref:AraC family transcriptional regulator n=1 Tax=Ohtaekwangia sp. TaxID=2066019 RepID=UPI002F94B432